LIAVLLAAGTLAFAADLPVFGKSTDDGNCTAPFVVITAKTYKLSGGPTGSISSIERNGDDFLVELHDGYRFAMLDVGKRTAT
jgi:hypothetical protein